MFNSNVVEDYFDRNYSCNRFPKIIVAFIDQSVQFSPLLVSTPLIVSRERVAVLVNSIAVWTLSAQNPTIGNPLNN